MEVALDIAFQCSPDHPTSESHPEWFFHRSDGSIRYAENPPKKYFDIYPLHFENEHWKELWHEMLSVVVFWVQKGVTIFRVDNPHTKPLGFWEWMIGTVKEAHPEVIFFAEAFTRPKPVKRLAKLGLQPVLHLFRLEEHEAGVDRVPAEFVTSKDVAEYLQGELLHQHARHPVRLPPDGRAARLQDQAALAATLSSLYGIYSGYELCENDARGARLRGIPRLREISATRSGIGTGRGT